MRKRFYALAIATMLGGSALCVFRQLPLDDTVVHQAESEAPANQRPTEASDAAVPNAMAKIVETHEKVVHYTVRVPVHETHTKQVNYTVMCPVAETREKEVYYTVMKQVTEEHMTSDNDESQDRIVKTIKYIPERRARAVSYTVTKMVPETRTKTISYRTCRMVTEKRQKTVQYTTTRYVPMDALQSESVDENSDPIGTNRCLN
jgi:YTV